MHELVTNLVCNRLARKIVHVAMDGDHHDRVIDFLLVDHRFLGQCRERRNSVDASLDFVQNLVDVGVDIGFDRYGPETLAGARADSLDALDVLHRLFDLDDDAFLDFLWRRAEVRHFYLHPVELELRLCFLANREGRDQARNDDEQHQQVGRDMIRGKPGDDAILVRFPGPSHG